MKSTLLSVLLIASPALAGLSMKSIDISFDDFSPLLVYDPPVPPPTPNKPIGDETAYPIRPVKSTWNCSAVENQWSTWKPWTRANSGTYHWASKGATVQVNFTGTGIVVNGADGIWDYWGTASLKVDGQEGTCNEASTKIQCSLKNLSHGKHTALITVESGNVTIGDVTISQDIMTSLSDTKKTAIEEWPTNKDGAIDPRIKTSGFYPETSVNGLSDNPYPRIFGNESGAYASVKVPPKTSVVQIWGMVDVDHSQYRVDINPALPTGEDKVFLDAFNPFTTTNQLLFNAKLDPNTQYTVTYTHLQQDGAVFSDIGKFVFYKSGSGNGGGLSAGAIAGIVIGSLAGLAIIGALLWFFLIRKKRQGYSSRDLVGTIDNDGPVYGPQPTPLDAPQYAPDPTQMPHHMSMVSQPLSNNSSQPLLMTQGYAAPSLSGRTSSSGMWDGTDTASITTAGMAGYGAGNRDSRYLTPAQMKAQLARQSAVSSAPTVHVVQQHADAGSAIMSPPETVVEEVPPSYNPSWTGPMSEGSSSSPLSPLQDRKG